jgi:hypothetical protein
MIEGEEPEGRIWIGTLPMANPSNLISPPNGFNKPEMVLRVVVFPAPLGPMRATISFSRLESLILI